MEFFVGTVLGVRPPFKLPATKQSSTLQRPQGAGRSLTSSPRSNAKGRGVGSESLTPCQQKSPWLVHGLFCCYCTWGETSVQAARNQAKLYSAAPHRRGEQLDQLAAKQREGARCGFRIPYTVPNKNPTAYPRDFVILSSLLYSPTVTVTTSLGLKNRGISGKVLHAPREMTRRFSWTPEVYLGNRC